jgi:hypothetical protein
LIIENNNRYFKIMEILIQNILGQAKLFLESADEFYPFGCNMDQNKELHPMSVYYDNDYPKSIDVINALEKTIKIGLENKKTKFAAIGIDINIEYLLKKTPAIEIRIYTLTVTDKKIYKYFKMGNEYLFEKI